MGDPAAEKGDGKLPDVVLGPPIPPGEQSVLEPPREESDRLLVPAPRVLQPPLKVAPSVLAKGARSAGEIHSAFYKAAASLEASTRTAKTEFEGWTTADGLDKSHEQWEIQASNVAAWLAKIEESLLSAKKAYKTQDHATGQDLNSLVPKADQAPGGAKTPLSPNSPLFTTGPDSAPGPAGALDPPVPYAPRRSAIEGID